MKLSEPQKRVLRTMLKHECAIYVNTWGGAWHIDFTKWLVGAWFTPRRKTLEVLERLALLGRDHVDVFDFEFYLTPKGREKAKELQDDPG